MISITIYWYVIHHQEVSEWSKHYLYGWICITNTLGMTLLRSKYRVSLFTSKYIIPEWKTTKTIFFRKFNNRQSFFDKPNFFRKMLIFGNRGTIFLQKFFWLNFSKETKSATNINNIWAHRFLTCIPGMPYLSLDILKVVNADETGFANESY